MKLELRRGHHQLVAVSSELRRGPKLDEEKIENSGSCGTAKLLLSRRTLFLTTEDTEVTECRSPTRSLSVFVVQGQAPYWRLVAAGWLGGSLALPGAQVVVQAG